MSALHPILDRLGRDFERLLSPAPAPVEPEPEVVEEPKDAGAITAACLLCLAQVALGFVFWTGERFPGVWIALGAVALAGLVATFWPRPQP